MDREEQQRNDRQLTLDGSSSNIFLGEQGTIHCLQTVVDALFERALYHFISALLCGSVEDNGIMKSLGAICILCRIQSRICRR